MTAGTMKRGPTVCKPHFMAVYFSLFQAVSTPPELPAERSVEQATVGSGAEWTGMVDWFGSGKSAADVAKEIDAAWPTS